MPAMLERAPEGHPRDRLVRELGLRDATLLVVSGVIGSGIFLTPGPIADLIPHPGLIFAAWITGGLLSLASNMGVSRGNISVTAHSKERNKEGAAVDEGVGSACWPPPHATATEINMRSAASGPARNTVALPFCRCIYSASETCPN